MKLLLVNDDGINAKGIYVLAKELEKNYEVTVVAPDDQRSASSHSITITRPLIVKEVNLDGLKSKAYSVDGTPADCVKVAVDKLVDGEIDMVVSGINRGVNIGTDILYSGTVSAAVEAVINKIPSLAVSVFVNGENEEYETAAKYASKIIDLAGENSMKNDIVLNLNVPQLDEEEIKGIKVCRMGGSLYSNFFVESKAKNDEVSYTLEGKLNDLDIEDTDVYYLKNGFVTLTPLHYDLTNFNLMKEVEKWIK